MNSFSPPADTRPKYSLLPARHNAFPPVAVSDFGLGSHRYNHSVYFLYHTQVEIQVPKVTRLVEI